MFAEDVSQFFDQGEFAVEAVFTREVGGETVEVATASVIFNDPSHEVALGQANVEEPAPFLMAPAASLAAVRRRDAVAVNGAGYTVERLHPDGTGLTIAYLAEADED
jgi:hypothetical protein